MLPRLSSDIITDMVRTIDTEKAIESIGFSVKAVTKHSDGVSYDAHREVGRRILVRGPVFAESGDAMMGLYMACLDRRV